MRIRVAVSILLVAAISLAQAPKKQPRPLDKTDVLALLAGSVPSQRVAQLVREHGIDFEPTQDYLKTLEIAGAEEVLLKTLREARRIHPPKVDPVVAAKKEQIQKHLDRGIELLKKGLFPEAELAFRSAVQLDPERAGLHFVLGYALSAQEHWDAAIPEYRTAIRLKPDFVEAHSLLGYSLQRSDHFEDALLEYRTAGRLRPDDPKTRADLCGVLPLQREEHAITECREAIRLNPSDAGPHYHLGLALEEKGGLQEAIAEYRTAARLQPGPLLAHLVRDSLAEALVQKNDLEGALEVYRGPRSQRTDDAEAHYRLGSALHNKDRLDEAVEQYRTAIRLRPDHADAHSALGSALEERGDLDGAITEFRAAVSCKPEDPEAYVALADALAKRREGEAAIGAYRTAIQLEPEDAGLHHKLGRALHQRGDVDGAIIEYQAAFRLAPNETYDDNPVSAFFGELNLPLAHIDLGSALQSKGDLDAAIGEYREAIRLKPNMAAAHFRLGLALWPKGYLQPALDELRQAYLLDPSNSEYRKAYEALLSQASREQR